MIIVENDIQAMSRRLAGLFLNLAYESIQTRNCFNVALCGGSTPGMFHQRLAENDYDKDILWSKIHLFWVDERCVPENSPYSNYGNAKKELIDKVPVSKDHVHPMICGNDPEQGALAYQKQLRATFGLSGGDCPEFDLVLLGVGNDGHVASLFPGEKEDREEWLVKTVKGGAPYVQRLTLTYQVLNRAKNIVFLVAGKSKARVVYKIFTYPELNLPAQKIRPVSGKITWVLDQKAASLMTDKTPGFLKTDHKKSALPEKRVLESGVRNSKSETKGQS